MNAARTAPLLPALGRRLRRALLPLALAAATLAVAGGVPTAIAAPASAPDKAAVIRRAIDGYIRPAYAAGRM
jgi:hypothetical protein